MPRIWWSSKSGMRWEMLQTLIVTPTMSQTMGMSTTRRPPRRTRARIKTPKSSEAPEPSYDYDYYNSSCLIISDNRETLHVTRNTNKLMLSNAEETTELCLRDRDHDQHHHDNDDDKPKPIVSSLNLFHVPILCRKPSYSCNYLFNTSFQLSVRISGLSKIRRNSFQIEVGLSMKISKKQIR